MHSFITILLQTLRERDIHRMFVSALTCSGLFFAIQTAFAQTNSLPSSELIGGNLEADIIAYPYFRNTYDIGQPIPQDRSIYQVSPGVSIDLARYRDVTRLDRLPRIQGLLAGKDTLGIDISYKDRVYDLNDRMLFNRELTIKYDPAICKGEKSAVTAQEKILAETVCLKKTAEKNNRQTRRMAKSLRRQIRKAPNGTDFPGKLNRPDLLKLDDETLIGTFMNSGEHVMTVYNEVNFAALFDPTSKIDEILKASNSVPNRPRPKYDGGTDLSVRVNIQSNPLSSGQTLTVPDTLYKPPLNPIIKDGIKDIKRLDIQDIDKNQLKWLQFKNSLPKNIDVLKDGIDGDMIPDDFYEANGIGKAQIPSLTPEARARILDNALPDTLSGKGGVLYPELNFLAGFTYGKKYSGEVGYTFYRGNRAFEPIFVKMTYWFEPILTLKAPFHGKVDSATWNLERDKTKPDQAKYNLKNIDLDITLAGQNVDANGNNVFQAVGLPRNKWAGGHEFKVGVAADATLIWNLPGLDEDKYYFDGFDVSRHSDFAPPLDTGRARIAGAELTWQTTGLGTELFFGRAGVNFGVDLFNTNGQLHVDSQANAGMNVNPAYVFSTGQSRMTATGGLPLTPPTVLLTLDNPRYKADLEYIPYIRPEIEFGAAGYTWRYGDPIYLDALTIRSSMTLQPHEGTNNKNIIELRRPDF